MLLRAATVIWLERTFHEKAFPSSGGSTRRLGGARARAEVRTCHLAHPVRRSVQADTKSYPLAPQNGNYKLDGHPQIDVLIT